MFAGSEEGAERAAILFSLVASCRLHGVDPWAYFNDVLRRVQDHPARRVDELTPKAWAEARKKLDGSGPDPPA
jgi:transposase